MTSGLEIAIGLLALAAAFHATWNVMLKVSGNPLVLSSQAVGLAAALTALPAGIAWLLAGRPGVPAEAWLLALVSAVFELLYFIFLSAAYERGELSAVYPLARGTAPVLTVLIALLVLREKLSGPELVGVACLLAGIWAVRRPSPAGAATVPALLTGLCIAIYTSIDSAGVHLAPPWLYGWLLWALSGILLTLWVKARTWLERNAETNRQPPMSLAKSVFVGLCMTASYLLVLFALRLAPVAVIAPLRESAIVLVAVWGVWRLGERAGVWLRLGGAGVILAGVVLVAIR